MSVADKKLIAVWAPIKMYFANSGYLVLATLAVNVLALALPLTLLQVYDRIIPHKSFDSLTWLVIGCLTAIYVIYKANTSIYSKIILPSFLGLRRIIQIIFN